MINSNDNGHPTFISNRKKDICVVSLMPQDSTKADWPGNYVQVGKDQSEPHCKTKHKSRTNLSTNGSEFHENFNI